MKLLNLVYEKNWTIKDGELSQDEYASAHIVFLFGDTDSIKDEKRFFEPHRHHEKRISGWWLGRCEKRRH